MGGGRFMPLPYFEKGEDKNDIWRVKAGKSSENVS